MLSQYGRLGLVLGLVFAGCTADGPTTATSPGPEGLALSASTEEAGNNLSYPVIWSDGYAKPLRGSFGAPVFDGATALVGDIPVYLQQDPLNEWQAESTIDPGGPVDVDWIDWGDNLEARPWNENSVVRVEVVLVRDLPTPMESYEMLYVEGQGIDEMWGATGTTIPSDQATVYSHCARLVIQKIEPLTTPDAAVLTWDEAAHRWTGEVSAPYFAGGVWEAGDGPEGFSAEINIKGKVIYGYNWNLRDVGGGDGVYRLTFSLAKDSPLVLNTFFSNAQILTREEIVEGLTRSGGDSGEPLGGIAHVDRDRDITWIDVEILPRSKGGGKRPTRME